MGVRALSRKLKIAVINADDASARAIGRAAGVLEPGSSAAVQSNPVRSLADPDVLAGFLAEQGVSILFFGIGQDSAATLDAIRKSIAASSRPVGIIGITERASSELLLESVRAGVDEFLTLPLNDKNIRECVRNVCRRKNIAHAGPSGGGKVVTVFSGKGGCGKTMLATNLAYELAKCEASVVVLDLNLQFGNAATFLDLQPRHTIMDCISKDGTVDEEVLTRIACKHACGLALIPGPDDPADSEQLTPEHTHALLDGLRKKYDFVVVDTHSKFDDHNMTALDMADKIILVTDSLVPSVRNTQRCLKVLAKLNYDSNKILLVVNRMDKSVGASQKELQQAFDVPIAVFIPNEFAAVMSSVDAGLPISESAPKSGVVAAIRQLSQSLADTGEEQPASRGWFQKLLVRK